MSNTKHFLNYEKAPTGLRLRVGRPLAVEPSDLNVWQNQIREQTPRTYRYNFRSLGKLGVFFLSRRHFDKAAYSQQINSLNDIELATLLEEALPLSAANYLTANVIGTVVMGNMYRAGHLAIQLETHKEILEEQKALFDRLNEFPGVKIWPHDNVAHISLVRYLNRGVPPQVIDALESVLPPTVTLKPLQIIPTTENH